MDDKDIISEFSHMSKNSSSRSTRTGTSCFVNQNLLSVESEHLILNTPRCSSKSEETCTSLRNNDAGHQTSRQILNTLHRISKRAGLLRSAGVTHYTSFSECEEILRRRQSIKKETDSI